MSARARTSPRKQPRQARSQATVDAILAATAQVLCKHGYEGANTNRVAEVAGVSIGSLYQYFPNKEALVAALIARHCEEMWAVVENATRPVFDAPVTVAAPRVIGAMFDAHLVNPRLHRVLNEQVPRVGALARIRQVTERAVALAHAYLEAHKAEILPTDTSLAAIIVVNVIESVVHAALIERGEALDRDTAVAETTAVVLRYLTGGDGRAAATGRARAASVPGAVGVT